MKRQFRIFALVIALCLLPATGFPFEGPLQVKNLFPLFLYLDTPVLESAATESAFRMRFSYSSMFMMKSSADWTVNLDMEMTELNLKYQRDIPDLFEFGIEVPVLIFSSGFLDGFLEDYHQTFGLPDYGREQRPHNEFLYEVKKNNAIIVTGENGRVGLGDIRLTIKKALLRDDPFVSIKADVEFPTGNASAGFGSGSIDVGTALLINKRLGSKVNAYLNIGTVFPGDLKAENTVGLKACYYAGAALEAAVWESLHLLGQISFQSSPFPHTGIGSVDRTAALLSLGGRYFSGNNSLEFSLTEDVNTAGAPDVIFNLAYRKKF